MADTVVQTVISKAGNLLDQAGTRLYQLPENITWIQTEMRTLQSYLQDAESKKAGSSEVANLIANIRDLAQDVEDIMDTYLPEIESQGFTGGPLHFLKEAPGFLCYCVTVNKFALEIEKIKKRVEALEVSREKCKITAESNAKPIVDSEMWDSRKKFLRARESKKIFGREGTLQKLEAEILTGNKQCRLIVGPPGVGKTTVARRIYHKVKNEFQCCAIVYVSQEPNVGELKLDIAKQVGLSEDKIKENLEDNLYLLLQEKRYLILLDDVWATKTWDLLRDVLQAPSENGSRIIVTSRNTDVGRYIGGEDSLDPLDHLSEKDGKELFDNMILSTPDEQLTPVLKDIGGKIVARCGGLPLAIEVTAGMLRGRERSKLAWNEVLRNMSEGAENDCLKILALSYKDLPPELKPLFLYFGIFPENREILVPQLIPLWVTEKLIQVDETGKGDNVVEVSINKLISRNLIQVSRRRADGRVRSCRIHALLHDLCTRVAEDNNFFYTRNNLKSRGVPPIVRRVTTYTSSSDKYAFKDVQIPKIRALFCFSRDKELFRYVRDHASDLRFLRLLIIEVEDGALSLPNEIANLRGLSYLKLKGELSEIPAGIRRLKKLETLEIKSKDVPEAILKMKHLKHLFLSSLTMTKSFGTCGHRKSGGAEDGIEVNLQNLETLDLDFGLRYCLTSSSLKKLPRLVRLRIYVTKKQVLEVLFGKTLVLQKLEDLKMDVLVSIFNEIPRLDMSQYKSLKKLNLYFDIPQKIAEMVEFPPNLVKITLRKVEDLEDHMGALKSLSKLEIIKLKRCSAHKLDFSGEKSFPQLQVLMLKDTKFQELLADDEGLPSLDKFIYRRAVLSYSTSIPPRLIKIMGAIDQYQEE